MANNLKLANLAKNTEADATMALLNSGVIKVYSGAQPATADSAITGTLLVTFTFGATAAPASSGGVATANAITSGVAVATGTAGYCVVEKSNGTTVVMMGSVGTSSADLVLDTVSIVSGAPISCSSFTYTRS